MSCGVDRLIIKQDNKDADISETRISPISVNGLRDSEYPASNSPKLHDSPPKPQSPRRDAVATPEGDVCIARSVSSVIVPAASPVSGTLRLKSQTTHRFSMDLQLRRDADPKTYYLKLTTYNFIVSCLRDAAVGNVVTTVVKLYIS